MSNSGLRINNNLFSGRILSIDVFRGITIFTMIFVNELAGVQEIPAWLKHAPAETNTMTFVDVVFPAFLFIVGMSIPFALNTRLQRKENKRKIWSHVLKRSLALIIMGVYMVNTEYGYDASKMLIPMAVWGFFAYFLPIPIWNIYPSITPVILKQGLRWSGILGLITLYFLYTQSSGSIGITPKWWGILGLIGWSYLIGTIIYWLSNGRLVFLGFSLLLCIALNCLKLSSSLWINDFPLFRFIAGQMTHTTLVIAGSMLSLCLFQKIWKYRSFIIVGFAISFLVLGALLKPYFGVSKILGTPSWVLYSVGFFSLFFYILYILIEGYKWRQWSHFFMPAAANPLLIYILPGVIYYFNKSLGIAVLPIAFSKGFLGIIWCLLFSIAMLYLIKLCNKLHIKLRV